LTTLTLEEPLTEVEKEKLHKLINDPDALDQVIDKALKGWRSGWKGTKKS
jgi:hypothetical protein